MNERIKDILTRPVFERLNDWANIGPVQKATMEEFTEVIVKECVNRLRTEMYRLDALPGREVSAQTMETAQVLIQNYFRVEE